MWTPLFACGDPTLGFFLSRLFGPPAQALVSLLPAARVLALVALLVICTFTDLRELKIYNRVTYRFLILMLLLAAGFDLLAPTEGRSSRLSAHWPQVLTTTPPALEVAPWSQLQLSLAGGFLCGLTLLPLWLTTGRGGGDLKLAVVIGTAVGPELGLKVIGMTFLIGCVATFVWMAWRMGPWQSVSLLFRQTVGALLPRLVAPATAEERLVLLRPIPLAGFFALGTLVVVGGVL